MIQLRQPNSDNPTQTTQLRQPNSDPMTHQKVKELYVPTLCDRNTIRKQTFKKSTRQNHEFEKFILEDKAQFILDATRSRRVPLTYFTENSPPSATRNRRQHGKAEIMNDESYQIISLQKPGGHAHSLVIIKSKAITSNASNIGIFEPNGQCTQREFDIINTTSQSEESNDVTQQYLSISPKICINYGNDTYNPGYCGIFGMILIIAFRYYKGETTKWLKKWKQLLEYMRQEIPDEPESHGCLGVTLAAKVQEIIAAATPASPAAFQNAEKEIIKEIKKCIASIAQHKTA
jgi:hypothetical protein